MASRYRGLRKHGAFSAGTLFFLFFRVGETARVTSEHVPEMLPKTFAYFRAHTSDSPGFRFPSDHAYDEMSDVSMASLGAFRQSRVYAVDFQKNSNVPIGD